MNVFLLLLQAALAYVVSALIVLLTAISWLRERFLSKQLKFPDPKSILITGATSGIGYDLALSYAKPGVHLALTGRNKERLNDIKTRCEEKGATVSTFAVDVVDREAMLKAIIQAHGTKPLDLVIANAGVSGGTVADPSDMEGSTRTIMQSNIDGVLNTIFPAIHLWKARENPASNPVQLALMSSLASFTPVSNPPAYSASKAAVRILGAGLRANLEQYNVGVSVIVPGYVKSPMTAANDYKMPFLMETAAAIKAIKDGLAANDALIAFPKRLYMIVWMASCLPTELQVLVFRKALTAERKKTK